MSRANRVVVLGRGAGRAAAAAAFLGGSPGVALISDQGPQESAAWPEGGWTAMMRDLRRLDVDCSRFRLGSDPDEIPLGRHVTTAPAATADVLLVDMSLPPEVVRAALYHARGKVVLEPGVSRTWVATFAPFVHLLTPTPDALRALSDAPADAGVPAQARDLAERLRVTVVVPVGAGTALLAAPGRTPEQISTPVDDEAVQDQRSEDCFRGVLAALLAGKTPLVQAVRTALHAASLLASGRLAHWPSRSELTTLA
ncbi:hypothetical protein KIH74_32370 [Kineosporia sp. J2-2]|uniref:Uncharacterized protein n=1 Tax=Kineosporia corallincola TaxID=2835133 RepID=A0ABS5TSB1_9ACTN|nr:hypothetical protein [Kineosporia corallincola]MBT0773685.1 hypothetical protein [Kineosporia corallincola]